MKIIKGYLSKFSLTFKKGSSYEKSVDKKKSSYGCGQNVRASHLAGNSRLRVVSPKSIPLGIRADTVKID